MNNDPEFVCDKECVTNPMVFFDPFVDFHGSVLHLCLFVCVCLCVWYSLALSLDSLGSHQLLSIRISTYS